MKTSVIIITSNRDKFLETCLESLLTQTKLPDEILVIDNGSKDLTKKTALNFKDKLPIRYLFEPKIGIPYARNKGLRNAKGEIILMIDDDCKATDNWVKAMINAHKKHKNAWVIQGKSFSMPKTRLYSILAEFNRYLSLRGNSKIAYTPLEFLKNKAKGFEINTCDTRNISFKAKYLKENHLLFDENFYRGSDSDFGKQIKGKGGVIMFIPSVLIYHWERKKLSHFLEQRWHIGRTAARIEAKWQLDRNLNKAFFSKIKILIKFLHLRKGWFYIPLILPLYLLDRIFYINGWYFEKNLLKSFDR